MTGLMKKQILICLTLLTLLFLPSCGSSNVRHDGHGEPIEMRHAKNISMSEISDGVTLVTLRNPWDTTKTMAHYALIEKGSETSADLPAGTIKINVPIERSVVNSGVHVSLIDELGASEAVSGVCDATFINDSIIKARIKSGKIADCGQSQSPNMERIVSLRPQAIVLSPYEKSDEQSRFARTGIAVVEAADYMESTPLGRAEWMRFFGRLYGEGAKADSLFNKIESEYEATRQSAMNAKTKPAVLFDRIYSGGWDVPTSGSVTGHLIVDAGGTNPFSKYDQGGSAHLSPEEVLYTAQNADIWLVRYYEPSLTKASMQADNELYTRFKAFKADNIYGANTLERPLFEDGAFHPQLVLKEMVRIIHPELVTDGNLRYYKKLK